MNDIKVCFTSKGVLVCAERDKMLVFPKSGEQAELFLERAAKELDLRSRAVNSVVNVPH